MPELIQYIWKDRKRILGMPISFTKYAMSDDRLFLEKGLLNTSIEEILLYRVQDISLHISLGQRIFGVGTITVKSSDKTLPQLLIQNIKFPLSVKETLHRQVEETKLTRKMRVGEILDGGQAECVHEDSEILD